MNTTHASQLTNTQLVAELSRLARGEREATVALILHLAEFDARRLYEGEGFSSLFKYCRAVLRLSEDAIYNRIEAARTVKRYPVVVDMLAKGSLSPTTVRLLARHLTPENHEELLAAASGMGKQEVETLLAWRFPEPDVPASVRKLATRDVVPGGAYSSVSGAEASPLPGVLAPAASGVQESAASGAQALPASGAPASPASPASPVSGVSASPVPPLAPVTTRARVRPLSPERYEIRFTASAETREKLRLAQDLLGHAIPSGDLAQVFDRALTLLVADLSRKKYAATTRVGRSRGQSEDSRNIPAEVKRAVWARDRGRCTFVAVNGRRCGARRFIEFDHAYPRGVGGKPTVQNIRLRCQAHNGHEADLFYGPGKRPRRGDVVRERRVVTVGVAVPATRSGTSTRPGTSALTGRTVEERNRSGP